MSKPPILLKTLIAVAGVAVWSGCAWTTGDPGTCVASFPNPGVQKLPLAVTSTTPYAAESFTIAAAAAPATPGNVGLDLEGVGTLTGASAIVSIQADQAGAPSGAPLEYVVLSATSISTTEDSAYNFAFPTPVTLAAGTYWVVINVNGLSSGSVNLMGTTASAYGGGVSKSSTTGAGGVANWTPSSGGLGTAFFFSLGC